MPFLNFGDKRIRVRSGLEEGTSTLKKCEKIKKKKITKEARRGEREKEGLQSPVRVIFNFVYQHPTQWENYAEAIHFHES